MSQQEKNYDSTVMRIAGNVAGSMADNSSWWPVAGHVEQIAAVSVKLARAIVAEVQRTAHREE